MTTTHRWPGYLGLSLGLLMLAATPGAGSAPAAAAPVDGTAVAAVHGAVGGRGPLEAVVFSGQASISGKVIHDPVFGAPPVLEIVVDLSQVSGTGLASKKVYLVSSQFILHRPLLAFDSVEVRFPFYAEGDMLRARSAQASFNIFFSAAKGVSTSKVVVSGHQPA